MRPSLTRTGIFCAALLLAAAPTWSFEVFGFQLFGGGDEEDEDAVEILNPQPYSVTFQTSGDDEKVDALLQASSALVQRQGTPASGASGLIATARADYRRLLAALYEEGFYGPRISIRLQGNEVSQLPVTVDLPATAQVDVTVDPGRRFLFGRTRVNNAPPQDQDIRDDVGSTARDALAPGQVARASAIDAAGREMIEAWRQDGHALAKVRDREAIADHETGTLDVTVDVDPGPKVRIDDFVLNGAQGLDPAFIRYLVELPKGAEFDPDQLDRAERRLASLGVLRSFRISEGESLNEEGLLPLTLEAELRKLRRIGVGATLSSIDGLGLEGFWLHRNMFGRAERLRLDASIGGIGDNASVEDYDYALGISLTFPGRPSPDSRFVLAGEVRQDNFDTYRERSVTASAGIQRIINPFLEGSLTLEGRLSEVTDDDGTTRFETVSLIGEVFYDRRDNETDARDGFFLSAEARPFHELNFGNTGFRLGVEGRYFVPLVEDKSYALAFRGRVGSLFGSPREEMPTDLLYFTGGGGSVRGYSFRSIGVEEGDGDISGGRSVVEISAEIRADFTRSIGAVAFVDGGYVGASTGLANGDLQFGAGVGLRYNTGLGPIRLDLARAVNKREQDPNFAFYLGIGQAF